MQVAFVSSSSYLFGMQNTEAGDHTVIAQNIARNLRLMRERQGLSLNELATKAGVGKSTLSVIENGVGNPNIETIWAIASALKIPFGQLIDTTDGEVRVIAKGCGTKIETHDENMTAELLVSRSRRGAFEVYQVSLDRADVRDSVPHARGTTEHVLLQRGKLRVGPKDQPITMKPGDFVSFPADVQHVYESLSGTAKFTVIMDYD